MSIRRPVYLSGGRGQKVVPEGIQDNLVPITLDTQYHQAVAVTSQQRALNMSSYASQVIQPAVDIIANMIDTDGLKLYHEIPRFVGVPGTNPASNQVYIDGGTQLSDEAVPTGDMNRYVCLNPKMQGGILGAQATQFNPSKDVSEQNRMGSMGMAWGLNFGVDQGVQQHTIGALGGTPLIRGEHADGATVLKTDGWSNSVIGLLKKGDKLHWDGSEAVNPSSKEPTGGEKFVTVTADVDSNGTGQADIPISPALKSTGPYRNIDVLPADNAKVYVWGVNGSTHQNKRVPMGLIYHPDFITFCTVDLEIPENQVMSSRAYSEEIQLSVRHVRFWDGINDQWIDRFDVLGGWKVLRPEMAVVLVG